MQQFLKQALLIIIFMLPAVGFAGDICDKRGEICHEEGFNEPESVNYLNTNFSLSQDQRFWFTSSQLTHDVPVEIFRIPIIPGDENLSDNYYVKVVLEPYSGGQESGILTAYIQDNEGENDAHIIQFDPTDRIQVKIDLNTIIPSGVSATIEKIATVTVSTDMWAQHVNLQGQFDHFEEYQFHVDPAHQFGSGSGHITFRIDVTKGLIY